MAPYKTQPKDKNYRVSLKKPGPTPSAGIQDIAVGCWSMFGDHERKDVMKKLKEQPRSNPVDLKTEKSSGELS
jgi:hypothetical protein